MNASAPKNIAIVGAGVAGLASALMLGRAGHTITVFERDPLSDVDAGDADEAFEHDRRGAPQTRHSHAFLARLRNLLRDRYPDVLDRLHAAGATDLRFVDSTPFIDAPPEPGDDDLTMLACRRTTFDWVLRRAVEADGHTTIRSGVEVSGLAGSLDRVTGVVLADRTTESFDLVIVATGRHGSLPRWLEDMGAAPIPEIRGESGIAFFSRYYRLRFGFDFPRLPEPIGGDLRYLKYAIFPGDNGTFAISLAAPSEDTELRRLLDDEVRFDAAALAIASTASYLDGRAVPISGVHAKSGLINRWRDFVVDGTPVAVGVFAVGDALILTNPLYGRGCTTGVWSAQLLADALAAHPDDLSATALHYDTEVCRHLKPWVLSTIRIDNETRRVSSADLEETDVEETDVQGSDVEGSRVEGDSTDPTALWWTIMRDGLRIAMKSDIEVLRAVGRHFNMLTAPNQLIDDADFVARVTASWNGRDSLAPMPPLGPSRSELMKRLARLRTNATPLRRPILAEGTDLSERSGASAAPANGVGS